MSTATVTLRIENHYVGGPVIVTTPTAAIPLPPDAADEEAMWEWEQDHIFNYTGTGREHGDAAYFVEIVESTVPELVGRTFEFGI